MLRKRGQIVGFQLYILLWQLRQCNTHTHRPDMEPFFYLHAELNQVDATSSRRQYCGRIGATRRYALPQPAARPAATTTTLSLFGKDVSGRTVVLRIHGYRITFYASFRDAELNKYCCVWLAKTNADKRVLSLKSVTGFESMLLDKNHQVADANNYADTTLQNVVRLQVRTRRDVANVIEAIDQRAHEFYREQRWSCGLEQSAVKYYHSNMDCITSATRSLGLDACRWCFLNTDMCKLVKQRPEFVGREYHFVDDGNAPPESLFTTTTATAATAVGKEGESLLVLPELPPPVKIMSFDIECLSSHVEKMPDAESDPVIQISTVISDDALGRSGAVFQRHLFTSGGVCGEIDGVRVYAFAGEREMLKAFVDHVHTEDPDIVTGYNINSFDFPYLFGRLNVWRRQCGLAATMGRGRLEATCKKDGREVVSQYASFLCKTHNTTLPGRIIFDMYAHVRKEVDLRSYTLNSVAAHYLNKQKDDVGYKEIPALFNGDADSRARLGRYCVKDAQLVLELAFKMNTFVHAFERCKVFRTMLQYLVDRGQQIKMYSMLLAWCSRRNILVDDTTSATRLLEKKRKLEDEQLPPQQRRRPRLDDEKAENSGGGGGGEEAEQDDTASELSEVDERRQQEQNTTAAAAKRKKMKNNNNNDDGKAKQKKRAGYDGAIVLDPISGIYHTPVVCLDYASLYPSIMIGYNLCFTTWVSDVRDGRRLVEQGVAEESPIGHHFIRRSVKKGVLPAILEMLLCERADVRKAMKDVAAGSFEHNLLDAQQHTLKIAANSIYGAIGCEKSILNFVAIPASVTAYGRRMILQTKQHVEENYEGTRVVYGDTDSVMVNLADWNDKTTGGTTNRRPIWECARVGEEMATSVTRLIDRQPIRLQFETVYRPFLLCTKKRYAAGVYTDLERLAAMDDEQEAHRLCRPHVKYKGLQVVRRDNCTFATRQMRCTLETLMDDTGDGGVDVCIQTITERLREELKRLFDGRVDSVELEITKQWKKRRSAAESALIHDRVAQKMERRDPNSAPSIGDRVAYVVIESPNAAAKLSERGEDPNYVKEKGLPIDLLYYAENQVANPIAQLLRVVLQDGRSLEAIKDMFWPDNAPRRRGDRRKRPGDKARTRKAPAGCRRITEYFQKTG